MMIFTLMDIAQLILLNPVEVADLYWIRLVLDHLLNLVVDFNN